MLDPGFWKKGSLGFHFLGVFTTINPQTDSPGGETITCLPETGAQGGEAAT